MKCAVIDSKDVTLEDLTDQPLICNVIVKDNLDHSGQQTLSNTLNLVVYFFNVCWDSDS